MAATMKIKVNPDYTPQAGEEAAYAAAVAKGAVEMDTTTAMENVQNGRGFYVLVSEEADATVLAPRRLEDMTLDELKVMMLSLGIKTEKQMKRVDVERLIRDRMDEIDIV